MNTPFETFAESASKDTGRDGAANPSDQIDFNDSQILQSCCPFESHSLPQISPYDYFCRLCQSLKMTDEHSVVAMIYIIRLVDNSIMYNNVLGEIQKESLLRLNENEYQGQTKINRFSIHRLIVTSILVTQKFYNDMYYSN